MKLKIDSKWKWLGVDRDGGQWFYLETPKNDGGFWHGEPMELGSPDYPDLEPGALYRRTGEDEWEKVQ